MKIHQTPPTTLIAGELDKKYVEIMKSMHVKIPDSSLHIISSVGHNIHLEATGTFQKIVIDLASTKN